MNELKKSKEGSENSSEAPAPVLGLSAAQWTMLSNVITVFSSLGILIAIIGVTLAYREQKSNEDFRELKETLELISQWEEQEVSLQFEALTQLISEKLTPAIQARPRISEESFDFAVMQIISQHASTPDAEIKLRQINRFFNRLGLCVAASVCDADFAINHFRSEIETWQILYSATENTTNYSFGTGVPYLFSLIEP
ncbi:hypothetical protein [Roseivivax lentus]|uniref:hypothetical protein n=1 Tax=Roseivivax lentus TaxID=633194 RepID=UPI00117B216D|nr:hypothetical protein [Roseivivax lentus]